MRKPLSNTAKDALSIYGGVELWRRNFSIDALISAKGLAFTLKGRPTYYYSWVHLHTSMPYCRLHQIGPKYNRTAILEYNTIRIEDDHGHIIGRDNNPTKRFGKLKKAFWWDGLDMAYFACYAFWNYFTLPALILNEDIEWTEIHPGMLEAVFPTHIPTHSAKQLFIFDQKTKLLKQHNYTADVISKHAKAANSILKHTEHCNVQVPTKRIVTPQRSDGSASSWPVLIDIDVHDCHFNFDSL